MRFNIAYKLGLSAALLVLFMTIVTGYRFRETAKVTLTRHEEVDLQDETDLLARRILSDLHRLHVNSLSLAASRPVQSLAAIVAQKQNELDAAALSRLELNEQEPKKQLQALMNQMLGHTANYGYLHATWITRDRQTIVSASKDPEPSKNWLDDQLIEAARRSPMPDTPVVLYSSVKPLSPATANGPTRLQLQTAVPVYAGPTADFPVGVLAVQVDLSQLLWRRDVNRSPRKIVFLTDTSDRFLAHPDPTLIWNAKLAGDNTLKDFSALAPNAPIAIERKVDNVWRLQQRARPVPMPERAFWLASGKLPDNLQAEQRTALKKRLQEFEAEKVNLRCSFIDETTKQFYLSSRNKEDVTQAVQILRADFKAHKILGADLGSLIRWNNPIFCHDFAIDSLKMRHESLDLNLLVAVSYEEIEDDIIMDFSRLVGITIGLSIGAAIISIGLAQFLARPLMRIVAATRRFADGESTDIKLPIRSRDEIGVLARAFQRMVDQVRQRGLELRESELRMRTLLQSAHDGILTLDERGIIESFNETAERMFGYPAKEIIGRNYRTLFNTAHKAVFTDADSSLSSGGSDLSVRRVSGFTREVTGLRRDGTMFPVEVSVSEVPLGNRLMFTCILRDITERKHAEEQARKWTERLEQRVRERTVELEHANQQLEGAVELAREASRAKDAFLATMSHELRTPLNAIIGYCEFMLEDPESLDTAELTGDLRKILASGRHLLALINDILDLAKIEAGKLKLDVTTFDLKPVINEIQDLMVPLVRAKGNTFKVEYPPALKAMRSDRLRVRQVLLNLLSNANKFTDKGAILLSILSDNDTDREWVTMRVSDTGKGMSAEDMKKLFTPFFQVDSTSTRKHEGTGLGLAISRRFANLMGGDIQVQSRLGEGSTFIVRIPLQVAPGEPRSAARVRHEPNGAAQPLETVQNSVLVIDDDPAVRELMERFLTKEGFRVVTAASGEEGLRLVKQVRPAAITLDAMMPGIDGWAVLAALKSDPATANIPIIMATIVDDQTRGFALGATDYLTKPIDWNRLSSLLKHQLRGRAGPVLVVEDEAHSRELMVRTLRREGWDVEEAENGRVALERFATKKPALILLDLMMPEMDGFQFVAALRLLPSGGDVPIIVVTARDLSDDDRRRLNGSVSQVLQKGTHTPDELLAEIHLRVTQLLTPAS